MVIDPGALGGRRHVPPAPGAAGADDAARRGGAAAGSAAPAGGGRGARRRASRSRPPCWRSSRRSPPAERRRPVQLGYESLALVGLIVVFAYTVVGTTGFGASIISVPAAGAPAAADQRRADDGRARPVRRPADRRPQLSGRRSARTAAAAAVHAGRHRAGRHAAGQRAGAPAAARRSASPSSCYAVWSLWGRPPTGPIAPCWSLPLGTVGGVFSALFGTGGPIYTIYLARRIDDKGRLRATISTLIFLSALARLAAFLAAGVYGAAVELLLIALMVPCMLLGLVRRQPAAPSPARQAGDPHHLVAAAGEQHLADLAQPLGAQAAAQRRDYRRRHAFDHDVEAGGQPGCACARAAATASRGRRRHQLAVAAEGARPPRRSAPGAARSRSARSAPVVAQLDLVLGVPARVVADHARRTAGRSARPCRTRRCESRRCRRP